VYYAQSRQGLTAALRPHAAPGAGGQVGGTTFALGLPTVAHAPLARVSEGALEVLRCRQATNSYRIRVVVSFRNRP
jgi:hypothetical protein